jgi:enoyl-CoA hydratase
MTEAPQPRPGGLTLAMHGEVAVIWLDRPEKLNAMARGFWSGLRALLSELEAGGDCRAVVITGRGRAFSAGGDIASFDQLDTEADRRGFQMDCMETFIAVERCPLPVIAAVNGLALGGGCELAMACDMVVAAASAQFGMPEANLGLIPGYGVLRAPAVIGRQWTNWMIMGGATVDAAGAAAIGLVQKVVADDRIVEEALEIAQRIAERSLAGMATAKALVGGGTSGERITESVEALTRLHASADGLEGRRAFLERRTPRFRRPGSHTRSGSGGNS